MEMMVSQYLRIEKKTTGAYCSNLSFIRAAYKLLSPKGKTRKARASRQEWIRSGLEIKERAKSLVFLK